MKLDRPKLKSGVSLAAMVVVMSLLASVVGYFLGSWMIGYVTSSDDQIKSVSSEKVVLEEQIDTAQLENDTEKDSSQSNSNTQNNFMAEDNAVKHSQTGVVQDNSGLFIVQVGAFNNHNNAKRRVEQLKSNGYSAYITSENPYKVQVGAFETSEAAAKLESKLKKDGFPVFIAH
ncbi:Sporulation related domain-containing protein [Selenihalanaerobacter shriftii]|uniref:Sporulation related domain-containing protein n=2 Tax=Selenihalanaerobacter shriftii TaxID=142842 RepID=A0A1T4MKV2_9FIRM|nr:Sporulation related domain-containing protein [Selenihalanaerobacter shriftii]